VAEPALAETQAWPAPARAWTTVALLMTAYFMAYIDRSIIALLVQPIKHALSLSDTQIGLLQGAAFSLLFMVMTFPAGLFADRGARIGLITAGIACWSVMTALCGLCASFVQLFLARMGVAVGEATLTPTAPSVISDTFPPERRALPLSLYTLGAGAGTGVALIAGGLVARLVGGRTTVEVPFAGAFAPWQVIFFAVGLPGLALALAFAFVREPQRRERAPDEGRPGELRAVLKSRGGIIVPHFAGVCLYQVYAFASVGWIPAFFMRVHGWSIAEVGLRMGLTQLPLGIVGAFAGGALARLFWRRGRTDANLLTSALSLGVMAAPAVAATLLPNPVASMLTLGFALGCAQSSSGAVTAAIQEIVPNNLRGRLMAIYSAVVALGGMTLGPLLIGLMNDHLFVGLTSVGKSMSLTALLTLPLASLLVFVAARNRRLLARAEAAGEALSGRLQNRLA
jgi:MFS family permease